jgi:hypothetical protein
MKRRSTNDGQKQVQDPTILLKQSKKSQNNEMASGQAGMEENDVQMDPHRSTSYNESSLKDKDA